MNDLNERQLEAVNHKNGPILIVAGAGSGKTKTLTTRLIKLIESEVNPSNIIAITFTNKAANEMKERVQRFNHRTPNIEQLFIGTFHSLGVRILKAESKFLKRNPAFTIYDNDDSVSLVKKILKEMDISKEDVNPLAIYKKISRVKNELLDVEEYLDKKQKNIYQAYEEALMKSNGFDFDDLIEKVVWIFKNHLSVLKKYQNRFQYILVDEFQDVNPAQYQFVKLLAQEHQNLGVVGDDAQAIYGFRGSDFRNFLNFDSDWPNANVVKLEQNYRSTKTIITAASAVIQNNKFQKPKDLWTDNEEGSSVRIVATNDQEEEAAFVAQQIIKCHCEAPPAGRAEAISQDRHASLAMTGAKSTAILYRTNAQSRAIEQELIVNRIPYKIFGGLKFYERKEIKDIIAALRLASNPKDAVSAERIRKTLLKANAEYLCRELPRLGKELTILQLINFFLENGGYFEYLDKKFKNSSERIENINELISYASEFKDLPEFLERVSLLQSADAPAKTLVASGHTQSPVHLMTIHLAKGLEFDNVFVIGCDEGLLPHQMSYGSQDELEEERRLMYVAMTRARKELFLSFAHMPSRFLYEIPPELTEFINLKGGRTELPDEEEIYLE